jgi:curved DNA-binding protein CbpA
MGTLYDLLGALPSDDADGLRAAFRRAAKATHPDMNADDPDAPRRFRELMRAYDILIDTDQRTTYDDLLAIALQPPAAAKSIRVYERVRKYASNTMAATIISGLLVAGYTLFGHFSNPPGAAEFLPNKTADQSERTTVAATAEADTEAARPVPPADADAVNTMIVTAALDRSTAPASRNIELALRFTLDNLWTRRDPVLAVTYLDRNIILYRASKLDRAFDSMAQVKPAADSGRPKISAPASRKVSTVRIPEVRESEVRAPLQLLRREPMIAALTP